jgi:seryl-tRNA synthetase
MFKQILRNATKPCLRHQQRVYYSKKAANKIEYQIQPKIDFNHLCENATDVSKNMLVRNYDKVDMEEFCQLNQQRLSLYNQSKELRNKRNEITSYVGKKRKDDEKHASLLAEGKQVKHQIKALEEELKEIEEQLLTQGLLIPNETHPDSPIGPEENARVIKVVGEPRQNEEGNLQDHLSIATQLDILDLEQAAITTGSSFYYLQGMGAFLELALVQYAMQKAAQKGFFGVITPDIVRTGIAYGCGFQPRSGEHSQIYDVSTKLITDNDDSIQLCLAGTAEIPLAGKFATKLFNEEELPKRVVGFGHAFRTEAGGRGVTTKGLYRVHQFSKVELFAVTLPEQSEEMMEEIKNLQEEIFTELGLCFR